jgi:glycosyltransferase involved in cell wall biosynthesis
VLRSPLGERFELRIVNTSPSEWTAVSGGSRFRFDRARDAARILASLSRELLLRRPDVVHVNTSYFWAFLRDGLALWMARLAGARTVLHFRGGDFPEFVAASRPAARRAILATLRRADRLLALTGATQAFLERVAGPERTRYVPNFVDLADFGELPTRAGRTGPVEVLFVGWIIEAKGLGELLEAARCVSGARFTLVGPVQPEFLARIRPQLDALGDRVRLLPPLPRAQVIELYRDADVFVLPTWREGFPNVVLEAMAAGLPIVATPVGAIPDAVQDGREGLLVAARDASSLAGALGKLVGDRDLRLAMGARARARVAAEFSLPAVLDRLEQIYGELAPAPVTTRPAPRSR